MKDSRGEPGLTNNETEVIDEQPIDAPANWTAFGKRSML